MEMPVWRQGNYSPRSRLIPGRRAFADHAANECTVKSGIVSVAATWSPAKTQAGAQREREAGIADGRDVLIVRDILGLRVEVHPAKNLNAPAQVELGVAVIQIAIGQEQAVAVGSASVFAFEIGGVIGTAGKGGGENAGEPFVRISR